MARRSRSTNAGGPQAAETFQKLSADGYRALGVAVLKVDEQDVYTRGGRA